MIHRYGRCVGQGLCDSWRRSTERVDRGSNHRVMRIKCECELIRIQNTIIHCYTVFAWAGSLPLLVLFDFLSRRLQLSVRAFRECALHKPCRMLQFDVKNHALPWAGLADIGAGAWYPPDPDTFSPAVTFLSSCLFHR